MYQVQCQQKALLFASFVNKTGAGAIYGEVQVQCWKRYNATLGQGTVKEYQWHLGVQHFCNITFEQNHQ